MNRWCACPHCHLRSPLLHYNPPLLYSIMLYCTRICSNSFLLCYFSPFPDESMNGSMDGGREGGRGERGRVRPKKHQTGAMERRTVQAYNGCLVQMLVMLLDGEDVSRNAVASSWKNRDRSLPMDCNHNVSFAPLQSKEYSAQIAQSRIQPYRVQSTGHRVQGTKCAEYRMCTVQIIEQRVQSTYRAENREERIQYITQSTGHRAQCAEYRVQCTECRM